MISDERYLYMFGGLADNEISINIFMKRSSVKSILLNDLSVGDPEQNKWAKEDPSDGLKPEGRTYQKTVYDNNSKSIFLYGGSSGGQIFNDIWKYDAANRKWTKLVPTGASPTNRVAPSLSKVSDGLLLIGGKGQQGTYIADCWLYNIEQNTWTQMANPPANREFEGHQAVGLNEYTVALWGGDNNTFVNELWTFNKNSNTWAQNTTSGNGPQKKRGRFIMEKIDNKAYIGGGTEDYITNVNDFYSLDLSNWSWTRLADMPKKLSAASSAVLNGKLYIYGGRDENGQSSNKIYEYIPATNQWTEKNPARVYPPKAPSNVTVELNNQRKVVIKWKNNSGVADKVIIWRKVNDENWLQIGEAGPNETEYTDEYNGVGTLTYYASATNLAGSSASEEVSISITGVEISPDLPTEYKLFQNYPNPFNPVTNIEFEIPKTGEVTIKLYDLLGREVRTLVQKELNAGRHKVILDGNNLTSGLYFYKIWSVNYSDTKKLILLK